MISPNHFNRTASDLWTIVREKRKASNRTPHHTAILAAAAATLDQYMLEWWHPPARAIVPPKCEGCLPSRKRHMQKAQTEKKHTTKDAICFLLCCARSFARIKFSPPPIRAKRKKGNPLRRAAQLSVVKALRYWSRGCNFNQATLRLPQLCFSRCECARNRGRKILSGQGKHGARLQWKMALAECDTGLINYGLGEWRWKQNKTFSALPSRRIFQLDRLNWDEIRR